MRLLRVQSSSIYAYVCSPGSEPLQGLVDTPPRQEARVYSNEWGLQRLRLGNVVKKKVVWRREKGKENTQWSVESGSEGEVESRIMVAPRGPTATHLQYKKEGDQAVFIRVFEFVPKWFQWESLRCRPSRRETELSRD